MYDCFRIRGRTMCLGDTVVIAEGSGLDSRKKVKIVDMRNIKTDGSGVPKNVSGAYQPVDWREEVAIQYEDGSFGTMFKSHLITLDEAEAQNYSFR